MITNHNPKHNRKDGFNVPEGYFDTIEQRLFERLDGNVQLHQKDTRIRQFRPIKMLVTLAAAVALLVGIGLLVKQQSTSTLSHETLENYFEYNSPYTLSNEFIQAFDEKDLQEMEQAIQVNQKELNEYVQTNIDLDYYLNY
ncbi:hypothetical protein [Myroides odoratus]|jgi:hypothetical protein|uniref:Uncharacterized protein n=1 Tax=Myroides odoratus TaxID=256 RepID=A0A9Q6Z3T1_MYROD|nr:hypothetical protein [Myroides odoratus]EHQ41377.1 hypothetical protein Myrod_0541 [Myroides odoratus DSM 2801]EKB08752.1 hypothetical protein HMPREF9716_00803 [Myroides odoratus CIP 103059]QQT98810.1 hypothetical protein I6I88_11345 [Myroides odoratus]WQD59005.1 hypothetical protein U0010_07630 [Myroides odoratus]STZ32416.1 Uncharacterised protein [Myroides odoratus]